MSFHAVQAVLPIQGLEPMEKFLLLVLGSYANTDNTLFPSQATLASDTCMSERSVRSHLKTLEARGLIKRDARYAKGSRTSDFITLLFIPAKSAVMAPPIPANGVVHTGKSRQFIPATVAGESVREPRIEQRARGPLPDGEAEPRALPVKSRQEMAAELKALADQMKMDAANRTRKRA